jgi:hypothetical protein
MVLRDSLFSHFIHLAYYNTHDKEMKRPRQPLHLSAWIRALCSLYIQTFGRGPHQCPPTSHLGQGPSTSVCRFDENEAVVSPVKAERNPDSISTGDHRPPRLLRW